MDERETCAVCGLNPADVHASGLGPTSYPRCERCLDEGAESIGVVCLTIYLRGGPDRAGGGAPGDWWPDGVRTFFQGRYVGWEEIRGVYADYEALFSKGGAPKA